MSEENREDERDKLKPEGNIPPRYEASFLNIWTIILALVGLGVVVVLVHLLAAALFGIFAVTDANPQPPSPFVSEAEGLTPLEIERRIEAQNEQRRLYATQEANLSRFGWLNREGGVVGIPVEEAMRIVAEQGVPDFGNRAAAPFEPAAPPGEQDLASLGAQVFDELGCGGCHRETDSPAAPTLVGIYGTERPLTTGQTILADDQYLATAILEPNVHIVEGYSPIMPSFQGRLTETQLNALIAYIAELGE
jgi:mono/diheme cytochrome c family protein